jgi:hypothetical protein
MLIRRRRTALSKTPRALADGLMLFFNNLLKRKWKERTIAYGQPR